jgi:hypothetical protein
MQQGYLIIGPHIANTSAPGYAPRTKLIKLM